MMDPRGRACLCGHRGCLETMAGSNGILQTLRDWGRSGDVPDIHSASLLARQGDEVVRRAFAEAGALLGLGLSWLVNLVDLELVIVHADPALLSSDSYVPAARQSFEHHSFHAAGERPMLEFKLSDDRLAARSAGSMVFRLLPDRLAESSEPWQ